MRFLMAIAAAWAAIVIVPSAHDLARSESSITVRGADVRTHLRVDLLAIPDVDRNRDGEVTFAELDASIERVYSIVRQHFLVEADARPVSTVLEHYAVRDSHVGELDMRSTFAAEVTRLSVRSTLHEALQPTHEHVTAVVFGDAPREALLDARTPQAVFVEVHDPLTTTLARAARARGPAVVSAGVGCLAVYWLVQRTRRTKRS